MDIKTDKDITGLVARNLRIERGMTQPDFWGAVGVKQSASSKYENGRVVPHSIRSLLFIRYVAGINQDTSTENGAKALRTLAAKQS